MPRDRRPGIRSRRAGLADDAGALVAQRERQRLLVESAAQLRIEEIHAGGFDFDQQLIGLDRLQRQLVERETVGPAMAGGPG